MRCFRHPRPSGSGEPHLSGPVRSAAPGPGERRHRLQRRQPDSLPQGHGARGGHLHAGGARDAAGNQAIGHTRYSTAGDTVLANAQPFSVACNKGRIAVAHNGNIINAAELQARTGAAGLDLPVFERHRGDPPPGRLLPGTDHGGRAARGAAATGGRLLAGLSGRGPGDRGARPARLPAHGHGTDGAVGRQEVLRLCLRDLRVRPDRRRVPGRCRSGRDGDRRSGGPDARAFRSGELARVLRVRARLFLAAGLVGLRADACPSRGRCWGGCWRASARPRPTWWCRCRTRAWRRRSATRTSRAFRSGRR